MAYTQAKVKTDIFMKLPAGTTIPNVNPSEQYKMIDNCLKIISMGNDNDHIKTHDTPAEAIKILHADQVREAHKAPWNLCAVVGSLNYLQAMTQPNLAYAVHQCAQFCNAPKLSHKQALKHICQYLQGTRKCSLLFHPNLQDGFKCYVDADWAGNWNKKHPNDLTGVLSHTRYLVKYANCPIVWGSKMQSPVALSTTEAELIVLSSTLCEVIHL